MPGRILGALPQRQGSKRLPRLGQELWVRLGRPVEAKRPATRRRWPWTWVGDDRLCKTYGQQLGLVGIWWSGQEHRGRCGSDGLLRLVVSGEGQRVIPVDVTVRRPDPAGLGRPCRDKLTWLQVMRARPSAALPRRGRRLPPPLVVADRWLGDAKLMAPVATPQHGTGLVEGKRRDVLPRPDGSRVPGPDLLAGADWPWRDSPQVPGVRDVRLTATRPTSGAVTVGIVDTPNQDRSDGLCQATPLPAPRLIRAWKRRSWIAHTVRPRKHLLATETCQVPGEDAYDGHLVWRLLAGLIRLSTARVLCNGRITMEESLFSLKHSWRFLDSELLE